MKKQNIYFPISENSKLFQACQHYRSVELTDKENISKIIKNRNLLYKFKDMISDTKSKKLITSDLIYNLSLKFNKYYNHPTLNIGCNAHHNSCDLIQRYNQIIPCA